MKLSSDTDNPLLILNSKEVELNPDDPPSTWFEKIPSGIAFQNSLVALFFPEAYALIGYGPAVAMAGAVYDYAYGSYMCQGLRDVHKSCRFSMKKRYAKALPEDVNSWSSGASRSTQLPMVEAFQSAS